MKPHEAAEARLRWVLDRLKGGRLRPIDQMWLEACLQRVLDRDPNPFGVRGGPGSGRRVDPHIRARNWDIAVFVHQLIVREGKSRDEALALAGEKFNVSGKEKGTAENAYVENKDAVAKTYVVSDVVYRVSKEGRDFTPEERELFLEMLCTEYAVDPD